MFKKGIFGPTELIIIAYLLVTAVPIIMCSSKMQHPSFLLIFRLIVIILLVFIALLNNKWLKARVISLIHLFFPLVLLIFLYNETDTLNNLIFPNNLDRLFSGTESYLFNNQPALLFAKYLPYNAFAELMYFGYFSYYIMLIAVPFYFYKNRNREASQKIIFIIINSFLVFYLIFIVFPVAGPQFYFSSWPDLPGGFLFGNIIRWIQKLGEAPTAAFPSSHVSVCLILIIFCKRYEKKLLRFLLPVACLLILSTVYIRAHYTIDIIAAFIIAPLMYWISNKIYIKTRSLNI